MKKILIILFLPILLSSCYYTNVVVEALVSSMYFSIENNEYNGVFYLTSSLEISKSEGGGEKGSSEVAKSKSNSLFELVTKVESSTALDINFRHVSTVIFHESFLEKKYIEEFVELIKKQYNFDFNFYVFVTKEKADDLYSLQNPDKVSMLNSILCNPTEEKIFYPLCKELHFIEFCREYFDPHFTVKIPVLSLVELWNIEGEEKKSVRVDGVCYNADKNFIYYEKNNESMSLLVDNKDYSISINNKLMYLNHYTVKIKRRKSLKIYLKVRNIYDDKELLKNIEDGYKLVLVELYNKEIDVLNIKNINYRYKKNYTFDDIEVIVKEK